MQSTNRRPPHVAASRGRIDYGPTLLSCSSSSSNATQVQDVSGEFVSSNTDRTLAALAYQFNKGAQIVAASLASFIHFSLGRRSRWPNNRIRFDYQVPSRPYSIYQPRARLQSPTTPRLVCATRFSAKPQTHLIYQQRALSLFPSSPTPKSVPLQGPPSIDLIHCPPCRQNLPMRDSNSRRRNGELPVPLAPRQRQSASAPTSLWGQSAIGKLLSCPASLLDVRRARCRNSCTAGRC